MSVHVVYMYEVIKLERYSGCVSVSLTTKCPWLTSNKNKWEKGSILHRYFLKAYLFGLTKPDYNILSVSLKE